jgi:hypothetical protein
MTFFILLYIFQSLLLFIKAKYFTLQGIKTLTSKSTRHHYPFDLIKLFEADIRGEGILSQF